MHTDIQKNQNIISVKGHIIFMVIVKAGSLTPRHTENERINSSRDFMTTMKVAESTRNFLISLKRDGETMNDALARILKIYAALE